VYLVRLGIVTVREELLTTPVQIGALTVHSTDVAGVEDAVRVAATTMWRWCGVHEIDDARQELVLAAV
jgi:hypothetical protein